MAAALGGGACGSLTLLNLGGHGIRDGGAAADRRWQRRWGVERAAA